MALMHVFPLSVFLFIGSVLGERIVRRQFVSAPACGQSFYTGITNHSAPPGTFIVKATTTSPVGNQLVWSIQDTTFGRLAMHPATGVVTVAVPLACAATQISTLEFRIRATDTSSQLYCESTARVTVLPGSVANTTEPPIAQQPHFSQASYQFIIGTVAYGTAVGVPVSLANANAGCVTYSLTNSSTSSSYFGIHPQTGQISGDCNLQAGVYNFTANAQTYYGTATASVTVNVTSDGREINPPGFSRISCSVHDRPPSWLGVLVSGV